MITWNPNDKGSGVKLSNNNLTAERPSLTAVRATEGRISGKWYYETYIDKHTNVNYSAIIMQKGKSLNESPWSKSGGIAFGYYQDLNSFTDACLFRSGTAIVQGLPTYTTGDILSVAIDLDSSPRMARFYKNGEFIVEGEIPWSNEVYPAVGSGSSSGGITTANFGATKFNIVTSNPEEWNRLRQEGYLPYDIENADISWWAADIENINISKTNIWYTDKNNINLSCFISHPNNEDIKYKILVNNTKAVELDNFISTPTDINIDIPIDLFTKEENLLELVVFDEGGGETSFKYNVIKENRDTFTFKRIFDFKEDYITDENIEVIYGRGLTLKEIGRGEVNIEIPTEGKSKISNIIIGGGEDKEEELIIEREMTYLNDLGEGKVYESRLLTEYSDITNIDII